MAINVFPVPVTTSSSGAKSLTAASANTLYSGTNDFAAGTYTLTCVNTTVMSYNFLNGNTSIATGSTTSGTVTINLASPATRVLIYTNTGSNIVGTFTLVAAILSPVSGSLETITSTGTYSSAGAAYVVAVGGGQGGSASSGPGGTGGSVAGAFFALDGTSKSVTIGAGGAGGVGNPNIPSQNSPAGAGGSTTFATNLTVAGGGAGGSPGTSPYAFVVSGSNGNGGDQSGAVGNGSGIGTGGNWNGAGWNGNGGGYGAGGGGASPRGGNNATYGGPGGQGIVYLVRM